MVVNVGPYICCPDCPAYFGSLSGFSRHMIMDHWWDAALVAKFWRQAKGSEKGVLGGTAYLAHLPPGPSAVEARRN
jgi:hypothetical protein